MTSKTISKQAQKVIDNYKNINIYGTKIRCPYINNRRAKLRASLRVLIGKGTPKEIAEEAKLKALKKKVDLAKLKQKKIKKFLVNNKLGIDCSGFVYHVLNAELLAKNKGKISNHLSFPYTKNPIRKLIAKIRPAENTNTKTLSHRKNSTPIKPTKVKPGDFISILNSGKNNLDHILIINKVKYKNKKPKTIHYTHSFQLSSDGKYNHGVRSGKIKIIKPNKNLLEQEWTEQDKKNKKNETYKRAKEAETLELKRLNALTS